MKRTYESPLERKSIMERIPALKDRVAYLSNQSGTAFMTSLYLETSFLLGGMIMCRGFRDDFI